MGDEKQTKYNLMENVYKKQIIIGIGALIFSCITFYISFYAYKTILFDYWDIRLSDSYSNMILFIIYFVLASFYFFNINYDDDFVDRIIDIFMRVILLYFVPTYFLGLFNEINIKSYNIILFIDNWIASNGFFEGAVIGFIPVAFFISYRICYDSFLGNRSVLNYFWERVWYLYENAPLSSRGETWIFYKNGMLLISNRQKDFKDITNTYTWKYNPKMNSIIIFSKNRTQVFTNIEVKKINGIEHLSFTSTLPCSLYNFSTVVIPSEIDETRDSSSS